MLFVRKQDSRSSTKKPPDESIDWALPDMEASLPEVSFEAPTPHRFHYEDPHPFPPGEFSAELVDWRSLDAQRVAWAFRITAPDDANPQPGVFEFRTGTVCRPNNHLCHLLTALGAGEACHEEAKVREVDPDSLIGRTCRVVVEHVKDDLGDVTARIADVLPAAD